MGDLPPEVDGMLLATIVDFAPDGILIADRSGRIVLANRRLEEMFGYDGDELVGQPVELLVPDEARSAHAARRAGYEAHPAARPMGVDLQLEGRCRDGSRLPVEISLSPVVSAGGRFTVAIVRDISERVRAEAALRAAQDELTLLEERQRIARDLHDTVLQRIFATGLSLQAAAGRIAAPDVRERIESAVAALDATIRDIRAAIFSLHNEAHPGSLHDRLTAVAAEAARVLGFAPAVRFEGTAESAVSPEVGEALVAVVREALSNVARHARATGVDIHVAVEAARLTLRIADDGVGLPAGARAGGGRGLGNMDDRARLLGGSFRILPNPGRGTLLQWSVPLPR